ncbi:MAG: 50S ribosome-binding GTPase, partial [Pirellulales bacterium]|nr:50S ribosome-binding GTPase [Pirellulales bacterium]
MNETETTRFAVLTPKGRGAVATVAVFGARSADVVERRFVPAVGKSFVARPNGDICYGKWHDAEVGEEVVVVQFASHTEIHCHGGDAASTQVCTDLVSEGCVAARWNDWISIGPRGRFAIDAIAALSHTRSERTAAILLDQVAGSLDGAFRDCKRAVEQRELDVAAEVIDTLIESAVLGMHVTSPWRVVIAGAPNVGKSSLLNAIVGYQRAIVVDQPGTTRDVVATATVIDGWPVLIADTAGLRKTADDIEGAGVTLAQQQLAEAD